MKDLINFDITKNQFDETIADRKMHLIRGAVDAKLLKWSDVDSALYYSDITSPNMRLHKNGVIPPVDYIEEFISGGRTLHRLNTSSVQSLLSTGATAVLNRIDSRNELIRKLCDEVAHFTDADTTANAYIAFSGEGSFGAHWDTHDVAVIQLIGKKHWRIYPPTFKSPLPGQLSKEFKSDRPSKPIFEGIIEAGDLLYLPRGWWHEVLPIGETFHIAIGMYPPYILHYISWLLQTSLTQHEEFRKTMRSNTVTEEAILRASLILTEQLNDTNRLSAFKEEVKKKRANPRMPFSLESIANMSYSSKSL